MIGRALSAGERLVLNYLDEGFQLLASEAKTPIDVARIASLLDRARAGIISVGTLAREVSIRGLPQKSLPRQIIHDLRGSSGRGANLLFAVDRIDEIRRWDFTIALRLVSPPKDIADASRWRNELEALLTTLGHPPSYAADTVERMTTGALHLLRTGGAGQW